MLGFIGKLFPDLKFLTRAIRANSENFFLEAVTEPRWQKETKIMTNYFPLFASVLCVQQKASVFFCDWELKRFLSDPYWSDLSKVIGRSRHIGLKSTMNSTHCIDLRPKSMHWQALRWGDKRWVMAGIFGWFKAHFKWIDMPRDPWSSWFNTSEGFRGVPKSPKISTICAHQ